MMMIAAETPMMDWWALELAFGHVVPGHHAFLDRSTGEVLTVQEELPGAQASLQRISEGGDQFLRIDPVSSRDQHRWMVRFIATVEDAGLRARLSAAVVQPGAFRVFKEVLQSVPAERDRWFAERKQQLRVHIERWLAAQTLSRREESVPVLRQRGISLLERLSDRDLPSAIAYLMHLGARQDLSR